MFSVICTSEYDECTVDNTVQKFSRKSERKLCIDIPEKVFLAQKVFPETYNNFLTAQLPVFCPSPNILRSKSKNSH